jgi:hypothetical protein
MVQKSTFNLDNFRSEVLGGEALARTNRFEIIITPPPSLSNLYKESILSSVYVEQTNMPGINISVKPFKIFGPTYQRPITSEYGGEGLAVTFHVDSSMIIRKFFEDWMHVIVDPNDFTVGYQQDYVTSIYIRQLDEQDRVTHEIELLEAFPRNMNIMDLNNSSMNQTHRLNILFAYRYWKNVEIVTPVDIPRAIISPETYFPEPRLATTSSTIAAQAKRDFAATDPRRVDN